MQTILSFVNAISIVLYFLKYVSERVNRACLYTMNIEFKKSKSYITRFLQLTRRLLMMRVI